MNLSSLGLARPELLGLLLLAPLLIALVVLAERARARAARTFAGPLGLTTRSSSLGMRKMSLARPSRTRTTPWVGECRV